MTKDIKNASKIGLALGGGGFLGAAHIGVIRALEEKGLTPACISGTSVGALIAALYAFGKSWQEIRDVTSELTWLDLSEFKISKFGLLSNSKLKGFVDKHIGEVMFDEAKIPLAVVATDISSGERVVLSKGRVDTAIMASTCIPGVFAPVEIDSILLVDGGLTENVPVSLLTNMGADFRIGVDLGQTQSREKPENIIDVLLNSLRITMRETTKLQEKDVDLLITPDLSRFSIFDHSKMDDLFDLGYKAALKKL